MSTAQALTNEHAEFARSFTDPEIAAVPAQVDEKGFDSLTAVQKWQLGGLNNIFLHIHQNRYHQRLAGTLDEGIWLEQHRGAIRSHINALSASV